jgi:thiamine pyrophosphokinase
VLSSPVGSRVSVLSLSDVAVVTLTGLEYPLTKGVLRADGCLGVSNAVRQVGALVDVLEGEVLVVVFAPDETFAGPGASA